MTASTQPTEREQTNWQKFYEVMEKHTRMNEANYLGNDPSVCLVGLTVGGLLDVDNQCIIRESVQFTKENIHLSWSEKMHEYGTTASDVWALAKCYHVHPAVVHRIYLLAGADAFKEDLGDALKMAQELLVEAEKKGYTWEAFENKSVSTREPLSLYTPWVEKMVGEAEGADDDDEEYD